MHRILGKAGTAVEWIVLLFLVFAVLWHGGKTLESTWALGLLAAGATCVHWLARRGAGAGGVSPLLWCAGAGYTLLIIASFAMSSSQNYGLDDVIRAAALALFFFWAARRQSGTGVLPFRDRFAITFMVTALVACLVGVTVYIFQPATRFVGTFFDQRFVTDYWPNAWADLILLAWPMAFYVLRPFKKHWRVFFLALLIGCLFLSYSRGAFLSLIAQVGLLVTLGAGPFLRRPQELMRRSGRFIAGALAVTAVAMLLFLGGNKLRSSYQPVESLAAKATFTADEGNSSVNERRDFWEQALALSFERPVFGWGPYSFRFVQPRLQKGVFQTSDHPHNVFLKLAMESGWPAAILFALILLLVLTPHLWTVVRAWFGRGTGLGRYEVAAITAVGGLLLHSQIDYNLQFVGIALPLWLLLGLLVTPARRTVPASVSRITEGALAVVLIIVLLAEGGFLVTSSLGRRAEARGDTDGALIWYSRSAGETFTRDMHLSRAALMLSKDDAGGALQALDTYQAQNAEDARVWQLRGDTHVVDGDLTAALAAYERGFVLGKYNYIGILTAIADIHRKQGSAGELARRHDEFLQVYTAFGQAILQNAHFIALSQNVEEFQVAGRVLADVYPSDATTINALSAKAAAHSGTVREQFKERPRGILW